MDKTNVFVRVEWTQIELKHRKIVNANILSHSDLQGLFSIEVAFFIDIKLMFCFSVKIDILIYIFNGVVNMNEYVAFALLGFTSFFTLINPLGVMPIYLTMTADLDKEMKKRTARKATVVSFIILVLFAFTGQLIFKFFGITINSLKVVGGVIFFLMGQDMLQARLVKQKMNEEEKQSYSNDISITPLAIPMICGPGAITNAILMMDTAESFVFQGILLLIIFIVCFVTYLVLINSTKIYYLLGETGNNILMRLMGLIVMVIAVEFIVSGLTPIIRTILKID